MSECRSEVVEFPMERGKTGTYVAYRTIEDHDGGDGLSTYKYRVALGAKRGGAACVSLGGEVDRNDHGRAVKLHLDGLRYYKGCVAKPGLEKGQAASMAKAALKRATTLVPNVTAVTLQDESYNLCGYSESSDLFQSLIEISLADHNMMLHGETWYMRKLGAAPASDLCKRTVDTWRAHVTSRAPSDAEEFAKELQDFAEATAMLQTFEIVPVEPVHDGIIPFQVVP
jgi:hypothetical protein